MTAPAPPTPLEIEIVIILARAPGPNGRVAALMEVVDREISEAYDRGNDDGWNEAREMYY